MEIDYIKGPKSTEIGGPLKYLDEIQNRLKNVQLNVIEYTPLNIPKAGSIIDNYLKYTYTVKKKVKKDNVKHIAGGHGFAYLLKFIKLKKTIVTCFDLIFYVYHPDACSNHPHTSSLYWKLNLEGIKKAERIITISEFSKREIIKYLMYPEDKIHIVYPAVNHEHYYKKRDKSILSRLNIPEDEKIILYVGSEVHRQNLPLLIRGFSELKKKLPRDVKLLKVGNPQAPLRARQDLMELIRDLNLHNDVIFVGQVAEHELPKWYNAADLFVYPCVYAGWSMPCFEAMACGTPVITTNVSVLPEVVGDGGMTVDPYNSDELAKTMYEVLTNDVLRGDMIDKGLKRARMFTWETAAEETLKVYRELE